MRKSLWAAVALLVALTMILTACGGPAAKARRLPRSGYYMTLVSKDAAKVSSLS
jgi:hypothetical protein